MIVKHWWALLSWRNVNIMHHVFPRFIRFIISISHQCWHHASWSPRFIWVDVSKLCCNSLREHTLLWCSTKHLGSQTLIWSISQSIYLIQGMVLTWSWIIPFKKFAVDRYYERVAIRIYEVIGIWVDQLYYKRSLPFRLEFALVLCVIIMGHLTATIGSPFLKIHSLTFLLKTLKIRVW